MFPYHFQHGAWYPPTLQPRSDVPMLDPTPTTSNLILNLVCALGRRTSTRARYGALELLLRFLYNESSSGMDNTAQYDQGAWHDGVYYAGVGDDFFRSNYIVGEGFTSPSRSVEDALSPIRPIRTHPNPVTAGTEPNGSVPTEVSFRHV